MLKAASWNTQMAQQEVRGHAVSTRVRIIPRQCCVINTRTSGRSCTLNCSLITPVDWVLCKTLQINTYRSGGRALQSCKPSRLRAESKLWRIFPESRAVPQTQMDSGVWMDDLCFQSMPATDGRSDPAADWSRRRNAIWPKVQKSNFSSISSAEQSATYLRHG